MQAWKRYTQNEFETSNPIKNTIYIYERCIIEFKKIDQAFAGLHFSTADLLLDKMEKIFEELKLQLNPEVDAELYENIYRLYTWISEQIREMQVLRQAVNIDPIIHVITQLKEGYEGVMQYAKNDHYLG
ncbi:flagellar export chaperone FliS [Listeria costaricensis]|uniref:flagellar export chaperone FliS n=1 Tax=Listeria costaricensis TaxID=2026604 RepID=UPI000C07086B|nr:flagellar protein FliS [Listeria costaricensis]